MAELLNIFYPNRQYKGKMERDFVHKNSEWHETFQCIFTSKDSILFQQRNVALHDYPGLLDVTVGGHIKCDEKMSDGIREIKEEMGLDISFERLRFLCTLPESLEGLFTDKEFIHIYTVEITDDEIGAIAFQDDEVQSLYRINKDEFSKFSKGQIETINGVSLDNQTSRSFTQSDFLPYSSAYFTCVSALIERNL